MNRLKQQKGITLIALVITIVILLILAGVSIDLVLGDNGIIKKAQEAKDTTIISTEKEQIIMAMQASYDVSNAELTEEKLAEELANIVGSEKNKINDLGDAFEIKFVASNKYYRVDKVTNIVEYEIIEDDKYAGDITKDIKGKDLDGSENSPYEINCIEDLVAFAIMTENGNQSLNLSRYNFTNKYVILTRTLDFKADSSYSDPATTIYGDLNSDGVVEDIKTELTKKGENCRGFLGIGKGIGFCGNFNGKGNYIRNLYQNAIDNREIALFINLNNAQISDLNITGEITGKWHSARFHNRKWNK